MKKIIEGWQHIPGLHCGSAALRDVAQYFGHGFSEELCFGLGGGLGFYYSVDNEMSPTRTIHVRGPGMEQNFFRRFGLDIEDWKYESDPEKAFSTLQDFIDNDIPVLIQTDIYYLDYYNSSTHFPGHIIVVCGYDDDKREFLVSDTGFTTIQSVSYENMSRARTSNAKPYPLENNWFEANLKGKNLDIAETTKSAIVGNAKDMLNGVTTSRGESGIERIGAWAQDITNWTNVDDWKWCSRYAYQVISKRGTEGAAFRHMYRDFLKEVSDQVDALTDSSLIEEMDTIGDLWIKTSDSLKRISELEEPGDEFNQVSEIIIRIYNREKRFYKNAISLLETRA